jgi:hypothetical protein
VSTHLVYSLGFACTLREHTTIANAPPPQRATGAAGQGAQTRRHARHRRLACDGTLSMGRRASAASWRQTPCVEALLRRLGGILGVQRQPPAATTEGAPPYSPRWEQDQGVRGTLQRGDGRAGKAAMATEEASVSLRRHGARRHPCSS